jgi:hypothetical protein
LLCPGTSRADESELILQIDRAKVEKSGFFALLGMKAFVPQARCFAPRNKAAAGQAGSSPVKSVKANTSRNDIASVSLSTLPQDTEPESPHGTHAALARPRD